jgi:TPR repeat protein
MAEDFGEEYYKLKQYLKCQRMDLDKCQNSVERLYREGKRDFRLGCFSDAESKFLGGADLGHLPSEDAYGMRLIEGTPWLKNKRHGIMYVRDAAEEGYPPAMCHYADCLAQGEFLTKNVQEAARYYKLAADAGDELALYKLGTCFENGVGYQISLDEAARYYKLSMEKGCPEGEKAYKSCLKKNTEYYKSLAETGNALGQYEYGIRLISGERVIQNPISGVFYLKNAADKDVAEAQYEYAECKRNGVGCFAYLDEALNYYQKAANQGHVGAMFRLGELFEKDSAHERALAYYEKAAAKGHIEAKSRYFELLKKFGSKGDVDTDANADLQFCLGELFEKDSLHERALAYYGKAAAKGHIEAKSRYVELLKKFGSEDNADADWQFRYALFLKDGNAIQKCLANKYLRMAAEKGHAAAQYHYGKYLRAGKLAKDIELANHYLALASAQGYVAPIGK